MQNIFQFLATMLFGKKWILFDLKQGYKATLFINEIELEMFRDKYNLTVKAKHSLQAELEKLQLRPALTEEDYIKQLGEDKSPKALYEIKKKVDGERAEEITTLKNRIKQMDEEIASVNGELQKGYAMTYKNRLKYDFIKSYKIKSTYADKK